MRLHLIAEGRTLSMVELEATTCSVLRLKQEIYDAVGVEETNQIVRFNGTDLEDDKLLSECGVDADSELELLYSLSGGADGMCCICCIRVTGGGLGCCPVRSVDPCWAPLPEQEKKEGEYQICCSIM